MSLIEHAKSELAAIKAGDAYDIDSASGGRGPYWPDRAEVSSPVVEVVERSAS